MWLRRAPWRGRRWRSGPTACRGWRTSARANFILARAALVTGHPDEAIDRFQKTLATSKDPRLLAWSHIYLGRMLDLDCKRDEAVSEYQLALTVRDGQQDTRLAAERGVKAALCSEGATVATRMPATIRPTPDRQSPRPHRKPVLPGRQGPKSRNRQEWSNVGG